MAHSLVVGMTESGKSTLAKRLVMDWRHRGRAVLVLDALHDPAWHCDFLTSSGPEFQAVVRGSRNCLVVVDEAGEYVGQYDKELSWLATRGRHWGHSCLFVAQRASQISRLVRDQCSFLMCFAVSKYDARILSDEWGRDELLDAPQLPRGTCIYVPRFGSSKRITVFGGGQKILG